ncbi:hypothetical protein CYY_004783 [Polysphondylium violaceum]|uniref:Ubiquitin carboxyl-terminal hydrolase n=1 Tax=Polysphondylium violaceum TaxID=133409 RepID=A0A8J4PVB7_9MYCE|nr:hypothetical protein CYY_004783 [Polysphondylium violaceum]
MPTFISTQQNHLNNNQFKKKKLKQINNNKNNQINNNNNKKTNSNIKLKLQENDRVDEFAIKIPKSPTIKPSTLNSSHTTTTTTTATTSSKKSNNIENKSLLEATIKNQAKPLLHRNIAFIEAEIQDDSKNSLKSKYKPINDISLFKQQQKNGTTTAKKQVVVEDDNVLPEPKNVLFKPDDLLSISQWKHVGKIGSGLGNIGNTCFLNSVLQCLTYSSPLANFMLSEQHSKSCTSKVFCMFCSLEKHIIRSLASTGKVIIPKEITSNLKKIAPTFRLGRQEDSHEFIRFVIEGLQKVCLSKYPKGTISHRDSMTTVIGSIFGGYLRSQVKCSVCQYESNTFDPFMDLSVDLNQADSLSKALEHFVKSELLDGSNKYKCCKCKKLVKATKRLNIHISPPVLTIQLKRFSWTGRKVNKPIQFDPTFNLSPYMTSTNSDSIYDLYGVLVHYGSSTDSGHYYCYVKNSNNIWYGMDDESVSQVSQSTVLSQKAYMLFYSKRPSKNPINSNTIISKMFTNPSTVAPIKKRKLEQIQDKILINSKKQSQDTEGEKNEISSTSPTKKIENIDSDSQDKKVEQEIVEKVQDKKEESNTTPAPVKLWSDKEALDMTQQSKKTKYAIKELTKKSQSTSNSVWSKDSQFSAQISQWEDIDEETKSIRSELFKDESIQDKQHQKDEWNSQFDKGRQKKVKVKNSLKPSSVNQFENQYKASIKEKENRLKYGDNQRKFDKVSATVQIKKKKQNFKALLKSNGGISGADFFGEKKRGDKPNNKPKKFV